MNRIDLLMAYFLSDISKEILNNNKREYGGGLNKFEPNDLNKAKVVDLDVIDPKTECLIQNAYESYRDSVLYSKPNISILKTLNDTFSSILK